MGRPSRKDADYFPFYVKDGRTLTVLQQAYGLAGIGFFTNLMRILTQTPDHFINISDEADRIFFFAHIGTDEVTGAEMLKTIQKTKKIHRKLWEEYQIIYCPDLVDSLSWLYEKRKTRPPSAEEILHRVSGAEKNIIGLLDHNRVEKPVSGAVMPQSKVKESKGKESKDTVETAVSTPSSKSVNSIPYAKIVEFLNQQVGKDFRHATKATRRLIQARWREGFREEDFRRVIMTKANQWKGDPKMTGFLRPDTLFGTKFEGYRQEWRALPPEKRPLTDEEVAERERVDRIEKILYRGRR